MIIVPQPNTLYYISL